MRTLITDEPISIEDARKIVAPTDCDPTNILIERTIGNGHNEMVFLVDEEGLLRPAAARQKNTLASALAGIPLVGNVVILSGAGAKHWS